MIIKKRHDVKCPHCGAIMSRELWNLVDLRFFPEIVSEITDGKFNVLDCVKCRTSFYCEVPFIYQDPDKKIFVTVFPQNMKSEEKTLKARMGELGNEKLPDGIQKFIFFGIEAFAEFIARVEGKK